MISKLRRVEQVVGLVRIDTRADSEAIVIRDKGEEINSGHNQATRFVCELTDVKSNLNVKWVVLIALESKIIQVTNRNSTLKIKVKS